MCFAWVPLKAGFLLSEENCVPRTPVPPDRNANNQLDLPTLCYCTKQLTQSHHTLYEITNPSPS